MSGFRFIKIEGDARSRGESYGRQARDLIARAVELYGKGFRQRGHDWSDVISVGAAFGQRIKAISSDMYIELEGIAAGAGREVGEIVALNARTELLYGTGLGADADAQSLGGEGCTGAIALPVATRDGHVLHGQNWDWRKESAEFTILLHIEPDTGPSILTLVEAGTLARCGLNSEGLAVTGNFLKGADDFNPKGVPAPFIRRKILMSSNFHDAMAAIIRVERSFSINVMVSDGAGGAINFETTPEKLFWIRAENGLLVHSNHFKSPGALATLQDLALYVTPDTLYRDVRVREHLEGRHGNIVIDDFKDALADKYGAPYSVCRDAAEGPGGESAATLATVVMDVTAREMSVAAKPYKGAEYETYAFSGERLVKQVA